MARPSPYPQYLSRHLLGDQCHDLRAMLKDTRQMQGQTFGTSPRRSLSKTEGSWLPSQHRPTKQMQESHSLFCVPVSPTATWLLSQKGKLHKTDPSGQMCWWHLRSYIPVPSGILPGHSAVTCDGETFSPASSAGPHKLCRATRSTSTCRSLRLRPH